MKDYTSKEFFQFTVKIYDPYSMANIELEEEEGFKAVGVLSSKPVDYVAGIKLCKAEDIIGMIESYHKGQSIEDIVENGFPCSVITIKENQEINSYECVWTLKEFIKKLNEHMKLKLI